MRTKKNSGYSEEVANIYITKDTEVILLSTEPEERVKWVDNKPTNEVTGYRILCGMPDDYFYVKLDKKIKLPPFKSDVKFQKLEACEVQGNVYFRAEGVEEA